MNEKILLTLVKEARELMELLHEVAKIGLRREDSVSTSKIEVHTTLNEEIYTHHRHTWKLRAPILALMAWCDDSYSSEESKYLMVEALFKQFQGDDEYAPGPEGLCGDICHILGIKLPDEPKTKGDDATKAPSN